MRFRFHHSAICCPCSTVALPCFHMAHSVDHRTFWRWAQARILPAPALPVKSAYRCLHALSLGTRYFTCTTQPRLRTTGLLINSALPQSAVPSGAGHKREFYQRLLRLSNPLTVVLHTFVLHTLSLGTRYFIRTAQPRLRTTGSLIQQRFTQSTALSGAGHKRGFYQRLPYLSNPPTAVCYSLS